MPDEIDQAPVWHGRKDMAVIRHETIRENTGFVPLCRFAKRFGAEIRDVATHDEMSSMVRSNRYGERRAAADSAGLREGFYVFGDFFVAPEVLVERPMREEMADVQVRRLAAGADEVFGPGQLVEELVPDLRDVPDFHPAHPDAGIGRVKQN